MTMRAVVFRRAGPPSVLELHTDWLKPTLAYGQVKVKIFATSVNPIDHKVRAGAYFPYLLKTPHVCLTRCGFMHKRIVRLQHSSCSRLQVPGADVAGVVTECASERSRVSFLHACMMFI